MSEMVEKVARAICCPRGCDYADYDGKGICALDQLKNYEDRARAAIAAMREPTDAMIYAAYRSLRDDGLVASEVWPAMIDECLK